MTILIRIGLGIVQIEYIGKLKIKWIQIIASIAYMILMICPWLILIALHLSVPLIDDFFQMRRELRRVLNTGYLGCCFAILSNILNGTQYKIEIIGRTISFNIVSFTVFTISFFMTKWVLINLNKYVKYEMNVIGQKEIDMAFAENISTKNQDNQCPSYGLKSIIRTEYGFDLFARHLVSEFAIETLLAFFEIEAFQRALIEDMRRKESVNVSGLTLIGFPRSLPESAIVHRPINTYTRLVNRKRKATLTAMKKMDSFENDNEKSKSKSNTHNSIEIELALNRKEMDDERVCEESSVLVFKKMAYDIFKKYIETGSHLEINLNSSQRAHLTTLMRTFTDWRQNNIYSNKFKLLHLFDRSKRETFKLMTGSFKRFRETPNHAKWVQLAINIHL